MTKFKIILDNPQETETERESKLRAKLNTNKDLSKILIFCYNLQPAGTTEIANAIMEWQKYPFDRTACYRMLKELTSCGLLTMESSDRAMIRNSDIHLVIRKKYLELLESIPEHFQKRFKHLYFFYVNKYGEEFIPWACKILNIKYEEKR